MSGYTVTSAADSQAAGTLRWAITQVDQPNGAGPITFRYRRRGHADDQVVQSLPAITNSVVIDGDIPTGLLQARRSSRLMARASSGQVRAGLF